MTDFTPTPQLAATVSPSVEQTVAAPLEASHSHAAPLFSFDDEPLFEVDGSATTLPPDDFFSSPEWTDPSPALSMAMSFAVDSCDTSPLLTDNYDAPDLSGVPLFGDYYSARSPQNAFNSTKDINEESGFLLLRALNKRNVAISQDAEDVIKRDSSSSVPLTASPTAISSPMPFHRPSLYSSSSAESLLDRQSSSSSHGIKRRRDTTELLPMDAPIQPRKYLAPSKTSRKELQDFEVEAATEEEAIRKEKNPLLAKRRQNTLAARRSRLRKAAELQELYETVDELRNEKEMWKARCLRLEKNLDQ